MSDFIAKTRSNYFRVRSLPKFWRWLEKLGLTAITTEADSTLVGFMAEAGIPTCDPVTEKEINFIQELARHLAPDEVAVVMEVGAESIRYLSGNAWAVNHQGKTEELSLYDIHAAARRLGPNVTLCEF